MEISEIKDIVPEMKSVDEELISRLNTAKERINELEDMSVRTSEINM